MRVLRRRAVSELVQVHLPDDAVALRLESLDRERRRGRKVLGEERRAVRRHEPGGLEEILDGERDALGRLLGESKNAPGGQSAGAVQFTSSRSVEL